MPVRRVSFVLAAPLIVGGLLLCGLRVQRLEAGEMEHSSPARSLAELADAPGSTRVSARLTRVGLAAGEHAVFELCAKDDLKPERWLGAMELVVFALEPKPTLMLRVPLDEAHLSVVKRSSRGACLRLGSGPIEQRGDYSVDAVWPAGPPPQALMQVPMTVRVLARTPLSRADPFYVTMLAAGIALALFGYTVGSKQATSIAVPPTTNARAFAWAALSLAALVGATQLPLWGSTLGLVKGAILAALQAGAALLLGRHLSATPVATAPALGLSVPRRGVLWWPLSAVAALTLVLSARLSLSLVPATEEAPIQTFVAWPSGLLSFAAIGVLLPVSEELFFRGYLYRLMLRLGRGTAFVSTLLVFTALHAQQSWGNWGGLVAVFITGLVLTTLRALSGSVLLPAATHLAYNFALSISSF